MSVWLVWVSVGERSASDDLESRDTNYENPTVGFSSRVSYWTSKFVTTLLVEFGGDR